MRPRWPGSKQTQLWNLLFAMKFCNARMTVLTAIKELGIYALSQRCGELARLGWPIKKRMIELKSGKHVMEYRI